MIDFRDEKTNEIVANYRNGRTCSNCVENNNNECQAFNIDLPDRFTCLDFKGVKDGN